MNILFITHRFYPDIGGIEVNSEILAEQFQKAGHHVRLLTWSRNTGPSAFPYEVKRNPGVWQLIKEHQWADLVYENNPCLRLAWPSIFFHKPGVVALRTWVEGNDGRIRWQDRLKRKWLARARSVIAVSHAVKRKSWPPAFVIGNPYRSEIFKLIPSVERTGTFVFLGRLVSDKGAHLAIKALRSLLLKVKEVAPELGPACSLTIVGDGPDRHDLVDLAGTLGLTERVSFTGSLRGEAVARTLNAHKYLVVPSVWEEPFGNVVLEGMACGCIPIASDGGGLPDAVGEAGLLFSRSNVQSLANCMFRILTDAVLEERLRAAAADHLAAHIPEVIAKKYLTVMLGPKLESGL